MTNKMWAALMFSGWMALLFSWVLIEDRFVDVILCGCAVIVFVVALRGLHYNRTHRT